MFTKSICEFSCMSVHLSWALEEGGVLEEVDVEVDGAVEDGEEVGEVGDLLHPVGPVQPVPRLAQVVVHLEQYNSCYVMKLANCKAHCLSIVSCFSLHQTSTLPANEASMFRAVAEPKEEMYFMHWNFQAAIMIII